MRVISLVPSWTETLIEWGVEVVGRTRYCVHPEEQVKELPTVGGTKDNYWKKIEELKPDLIIADKEENRKQILDQTDIPIHVTHIESIEGMASALKSFHKIFKGHEGTGEILGNIENDILRWESVLGKKYQFNHTNLPGILHWIKKPTGKPKKVVYLIWKKPWMSVDINTYIGSTLKFIGLEKQLISFDKKYPEVDLEKLTDPETLVLFSSEPYLFGKSEEIDEIKKINVASAIVDGECYSWFGVRSLKFLESLASL